MIQSIYTSVSNADIVPCGRKGNPIKSEPIPLLRDNYLGEYRTELEKAKVRKNLGIADELSLLWGNISGTIEALKDLIRYIELKWAYSSDVAENINTVKEALDYALFFISLYEANTEEINQLLQLITLVKESINKVEFSLTEKITDNTKNITSIILNIADINQSIADINKSILNIDVDKNILNWILKSLSNSKTIEIRDDSTLEVIISNKENNAIKLLSLELGEDTIILLGLYVKDLSPEIELTQLDILDLLKLQKTLSEQVLDNSQSISDINLELKEVTTYQTSLPDDTISSVVLGTTVELLKGKPFNEIIDVLLFPTVVRDLIYPELYYSFSSQLVEVGTNILTPILTFIKNDAGEEVERIETITYNDQPILSQTYDSIGVYDYLGIINYSAGEYLIDNKGETTNKRIEAGSLSASAEVIATYPWYSGNTEGVVKLDLVPFGQSSGIITFSLSGRAVIKLPGNNTLLNSFTVDGGLGYLNVDLNGWSVSSELINGFPYRVWTKEDSYSSILPHQINFILLQ